MSWRAGELLKMSSLSKRKIPSATNRADSGLFCEGEFKINK